MDSSMTTNPDTDNNWFTDLNDESPDPERK